MDPTENSDVTIVRENKSRVFVKISDVLTPLNEYKHSIGAAETVESARGFGTGGGSVGHRIVGHWPGVSSQKFTELCAL